MAEPQKSPGGLPLTGMSLLMRPQAVWRPLGLPAAWQQWQGSAAARRSAQPDAAGEQFCAEPASLLREQAQQGARELPYVEPQERWLQWAWLALPL